MRAIEERIHRYPDQDRIVVHKAHGPRDPDAWFQPIKCGGGISLPGHIKDVPAEDITCPDCKAGRLSAGFELVNLEAGG